MIRAAVLVPIATGVGIAAVVAIARDPDYAVTAPAVLTQVIVGVVPVVAALGVARWWALRTATEPRPAQSWH